MDRDILLLSSTLCVLCLGIILVSVDIFAGTRRKVVTLAPPKDDLRVFLRIAPPMTKSPTQPGPNESVQPGSTTYETPPTPAEFIFRRRVSRDFASMELSHKRFRSATETEAAAPAPVEISIIRNEIRAVLEAPAPAAPRHARPVAELIWTEADRLAVLSLAGATPASGLALLKRHGIGTLIAGPGHPFRQAWEAIDILLLPDGPDTTPPLAARLRAKLARGERVAFYTETGLSGAAALLAARFSSRQADRSSAR